MRPRRQIETLRRALQQRPALVVDATDVLERVAVEPGVGDAGTLHLPPPCRADTARNHARRFAVGIAPAQLRRRRPRHLDVQVDPVEQRPRDLVAVGRDPVAAAAAVRARIAEVAAGA